MIYFVFLGNTITKLPRSKLIKCDVNPPYFPKDHSFLMITGSFGPVYTKSLAYSSVTDFKMFFSSNLLSKLCLFYWQSLSTVTNRKQVPVIVSIVHNILGGLGIIIDRNGMRDPRNVERICEEDEKAGNASFCRTELEPCDKLPSWL